MCQFVFQGQDVGDPLGFDLDEGVDEGVGDLGGGRREGGRKKRLSHVLPLLFSNRPQDAKINI